MAYNYGKLELRREAAMLKALHIGVGLFFPSYAPSGAMKLNGAEHIVSILGFCDDTTTAGAAEGTTEGAPTDQHSPSNVSPSTAFKSFVTIRGPVIALEYLELGDLSSLISKLDAKQHVNIPNRILWSFFLCLIRAVIGMAYPIGAEIGSPTVLEEIGNNSATAIAHQDIHGKNLMFTTNNDFAEHGLGITLKVIDFGLAQDLGQFDPGDHDRKANAGWMANLWDISTQMIETIYFPQGNEALQTKRLCPDLLNLLLGCLHDDEKQRPRLQGVFVTAYNAVLTKTAASFPDPASETDEAIEAFLQQYFFDAMSSTS
ncbi:hypothetical protein F5Y16DRAFT_399182 [Xylariaceae sp. FL0255]|nr:hypothetical protein F5Y16DRAFT_399182 [Xylariaceae sp. FL0255]